MKIALFSASDQPARIGVVRDGLVADVSARDPGLRVQAALAPDAQALARLSAAADGAPTLDLGDVTLLAPVMRPGKFLALGVNYQAHIDEVAARFPTATIPGGQVWFNKQITSIVGHRAGVVLPALSDKLDYEGELAFVIGRRCRHVAAADANGVIAGYMACNDVSVRDWQMASPTQTLGKSFDTHGPLGPWLVTPDEVGDPQAMTVRTWVNGELRQEYSTGDMLFTCAQMVEHLSKVMTLEPGDVITTGTSTGNGFLRDPPSFLKTGDVVRVEIDRIGALENTVVREPEGSLFSPPRLATLA